MSRLNPKASTLRRLFLSSGNQCAFPGCSTELVNAYGQYAGNICHIEAAEKNGERYNPLQSDEDRRTYENLILLCATHHMITDDVNMYPVSVIKSMKQSHKSSAYQNSITSDKASIFLNSTFNEIVNLPENLIVVSKEIEEAFGSNFKIKSLVPHAQQYFSHFQGVPASTRKFFAHLLMISNSDDYWTRVDIQHVNVYLNTDICSTKAHYSILENVGLLTEVIYDEDVSPTKAYRGFRTFDHEDIQAWLLQAIRNHYKNQSKQQEFIDLVVELNFNLLDCL